MDLLHHVRSRRIAGGSRRVVALLMMSAVLMGGRAAIAQEAGEETAAAPSPPVVADTPEAGPKPTKERTAIIPRTPGQLAEGLGWPFTAAFLLASFVAVWFGIERIVVLRRGRVIPRAFVQRFLQHLEQGKLGPETALQLCEQNGSPVAMVFAHAVRKWGKPSVEVEQAIIDGGERQVSQLRTHLRVLNGVATVSPLIGLLGTVVGMIMSFDEIAHGSAMGNADKLAEGIAVALLTTAVGLLIAIPSLILYMYLAGRVDALVTEMDLLAQDVVQLISAEALLREPAATRRPSPPPPEPKQKRAV